MVRLGLTLSVACLCILGSLGEKEVEVVFSDNNTCYGHGNSPRACKPPFVNLAEGLPVQTSSECGLKGQTEEICRKWEENGKPKTFCQNCNANFAGFRRGGDILTDPEKSKDGTCWTSDLVTRAPGKNRVDVTISFGKRFEVTLVSIKPCGPLPDAMAIFKSTDYGKTWTPWQSYSNDCFRAFNQSTESAPKSNYINEALCSLYPDHLTSTYNDFGQLAQPIGFNTQAGRNFANDSTSASNAILDDFITATDVRISLIRFPDDDEVKPISTTAAPQPKKDEVFSMSELNNGVFISGGGQMVTHRFRKQAIMPQQQEDAIRFFLASVSVVGRCKCNGHSNRCVRDIIREKDHKGREVVRKGPLRCDCQHKTEGPDCERCADGYLDHPWATATEQKPFECKPCQCNNHANNCRFNTTMYVSSNKRSGTFCECKAGFQGPNCEKWSPGFVRDPQQPVDSPLACYQPRACLCNWLGSIAHNDCDRRTGQCKCKEGVMGKICDVCAPGYIQTQDSERPCIKEHLNNQAFQRLITLGSPDVFRSASTNVRGYRSPRLVPPHANPGNGQCPPCESTPKRLGLKRFCRREAVFLGEVRSQEQYGDAIRNDIQVKEVWKSSGVARRHLPASVGPIHEAYSQAIWTPLTSQENSPINCKCPRLQLGQQYLFFARILQKPHMNTMELQLVPEMHMIIPWQDYWRPRLMRMVRREQAGSCPRAGAGAGRASNVLPSHSGIEVNGRRRLMRESVPPPETQTQNRMVARPTNPYLAPYGNGRGTSPGLNVYEPLLGYNPRVATYPNPYYAAQQQPRQ